MDSYSALAISDYNDEISYLQEDVDYYEYSNEDDYLCQNEDEYRVFMFQELIGEINSIKEKYKILGKSADELLLAMKKFQLEYDNLIGV